MTGSSSELVFVPYEQVYGQGIDEMFQRIRSIEKIRAAIGWAPTTDHDGILVEVVRELDPASSPGVRTR
jgi:UDP-glucose 4-epimerase